MRKLLNKILIRSGFVFNKNSGLTKIWFGAVLNPDSKYLYKDVPDLSNLREVVGESLIDMGYDVTQEDVA